jgi:hypothetical protein
MAAQDISEGDAVKVIERQLGLSLGRTICGCPRYLLRGNVSSSAPPGSHQPFEQVILTGRKPPTGEGERRSAASGEPLTGTMSQQEQGT